MAQGPSRARRAKRDSIVARTKSAAETQSLGAALCSVLLPGDFVLLAGDLGAGKTTLTKGLARALGVTEVVTSPTFTLVRSYTCSPGAHGLGMQRPIATLVHADLFRLGHLKEVVDLAIGELSEDNGVAVVEWGDVAAPVLGRGSLTVRINHTEDSSQRIVTAHPEGPWTARRKDLEKALAPWSSPHE